MSTEAEKVDGGRQPISAPVTEGVSGGASAEHREVPHSHGSLPDNKITFRDVWENKRVPRPAGLPEWGVPPTEPPTKPA